MTAANLLFNTKKKQTEDGFIREISSTDFITNADLSSLIGFSQGTLLTDSGWLEFSLDGKTLIVAKKATRGSASWNQIYANNAVYGDREVTINNKKYKIRILKGANSDPGPSSGGNSVPGTENSEWSRLFYPIMNSDPNLPDGTGVTFTPAELDMTAGTRTWCQETPAQVPTQRVIRGLSSATYYGRVDPSLTQLAYRWRPCLELVG